MKKNKFSGRLPILVSVAVAILVVIGVWRRYGSDSTIAYSYVRPGGDTLSVGIEMSPLTYFFSNDTAEGLDYEILRQMAAAHHRPVVFYPVGQLEEAFQKLYDGDFDVLVASMPSTSAVKKYFPMSDAVYVDRQVLVQRADSTSGRYISSVEQLVGDTVWMVEGSPFLLRMNNLNRELGDNIHVRTIPGNSAENLAMMTALGQVPRAVVGEAAGRRVAMDYPELDVSTPLALSHFQCWAVAPGDSVLLDSLNTWLAQFKATPAFAELARKYLQ